MPRSLENLPEWLQVLATELMRPPHFLQQTPGVAKSGSDGVTTSSRAPAKNTGSQQVKTDYPGAAEVGPINGPETDRLRDRIVATSNSASSKPGRRVVSSAAVTSGQSGAANGKVSGGSIPTSKDAWQTAFQTAHFPVTLPDAYGWRVKDAWQEYQVLALDTQDGRFAVKQTDLSPQRMMFLDQAFAHARSKGFLAFSEFAKTKKLKRPYLVRQGETYYATRWLVGQHVNFGNPQHVEQSAQTLAQWHEATRGLQVDGYQPAKEFQLARTAQRRLEDVRNLIAHARERPAMDAFDRTLVKLADTLVADAELSLRLLSSETVSAFLKEDQLQPGLCHLDVIPANMVYTAEHRVALLDFDLCTYAPRALDLAHLLRRSLQQVNWASEWAYSCFVQYNNVRPLMLGDYLLVQGLLRFPYRAWRLAHSRYRLQADDSQIEEIKRYALQEERRQAFLTAFAQQVKAPEEVTSNAESVR